MTRLSDEQLEHFHQEGYVGVEDVIDPEGMLDPLEAECGAVLDMSGPYQVAFDRVLPHAYQVADPSMWFGWRTAVLTWCVGESRIRHWDTEDERVILCIGSGGC